MSDSSKIEVAPGASPIEFTEDPKWWLDLEKAYNLLVNDKPTNPTDILYFFGRSYLDAPKHGLYQIAVDLYKQEMVRKIIVPGTEGERLGENVPGMARPGKTAMKNRLVRMGIAEEDVIFSDQGFHTRQEGDAFLKYSNENNLRRAIALTNPHQIVRAMLGLVKKINEDDLPIAVYTFVPEPGTFNWGRMVKGSQGLERKPVFKHFFQELNGISTYQRKIPPDVATFEELFEYIKRRDAAFKPA